MPIIENKLMMEIRSGKEWKKTEETDKSARYLIEFSKAKVQVFDFKKGYEIPRHKHETETLHIILKGKIQTDSGEVIDALGDYKCGGWEYGPWKVVEDTQMVVVE